MNLYLRNIAFASYALFVFTLVICENPRAREAVIERLATWLPNQTDLKSLFYNVLGGAILAGVSWIVISSLGLISHFRAQRVFGPDFNRSSAYHIVFSPLILRPPYTLDPFPYTKPPAEGYVTGGFSINRPVRASEIKAAAYISEFFGRSKVTAKIVSDEEIANRSDLSFISLGGARSNFKSQDVLRSPANLFARKGDDFKSFVEVESGHVIKSAIPDDTYDYGLILRISSPQFSKRTWIVCDGIDESGTSGAAWFLAHKWQTLFTKTWGNKNFAAIIRVRRGQDDSGELAWLKTENGITHFPVIPAQAGIQTDL